MVDGRFGGFVMRLEREWQSVVTFNLLEFKAIL
jgi:hypothetical protein